MVLWKSFATLLNDEFSTVAWERDVVGEPATCLVVAVSGQWIRREVRSKALLGQCV
ncbi:hypothetical protein BT96DRAFT_919811, partial [Gymnopus androsaceus JB14]